MSASANSYVHKIRCAKIIGKLQTLDKSIKQWCLVCGKYDYEHLGICTAKISLPQLAQMIQKMGIAPGKPLEFPEGTALTSNAVKFNAVIEINQNVDEEITSADEESSKE